MKVNYYPDTDSLYIVLSEKTSIETKEIATGIHIDFDASGEIVGIDIDNACKKLNLKELTLTHLPAQVHILN